MDVFREAFRPSILTVAARIIALETHDRTVHLLDFQGNQVLSPHHPPPSLSLSLLLSFLSLVVSVLGPH